MSEPRPTPFALVLAATAEARFPLLRAGLQEAARDPRDRDAFLLTREVVELLRELRPVEGLGQAVGGLVAFLQYSYLFWMDGQPVRVLGEEELARVVDDGEAAGRVGGEQPAEVVPLSAHRPTDLSANLPNRYIQLPPLRVWATPVEHSAPEPLDGWFVSRREDRISLLAIFGLHAGRDGLTTVEAAGARSASPRRLDGSPLFSPMLSGGVTAGLVSLLGEEELLELAWRVEEAL